MVTKSASRAANVVTAIAAALFVTALTVGQAVAKIGTSMGGM